MHLQAFSAAKDPDRPEANEDRLVVVADRLYAVIDGVTDRTGRRYGLVDYHGAPDADRVVIVMGSAADLIVLFLGLEVLSISLYVLAASHRRRSKSQESGLKYFILGGFSSAFFLYGAALIYGATGSTNLSFMVQVFDAVVDLDRSNDAIVLAGGGGAAVVAVLHAGTDEIADRLGAVLVAARRDDAVEIGHQVVVEGERYLALHGHTHMLPQEDCECLGRSAAWLCLRSVAS